MKPVILIAAIDNDRGIGLRGSMPWKIPGEAKYTAQRTLRTSSPDMINALIMGRKTYESLPPHRRPLPGRHSLVITSRSIGEPVGVATSVDEALRVCGEMSDVESIFVFGGAEIYSQALAAALPDTLLISNIPGHYGCDTFLGTVMVRHDTYVRDFGNDGANPVALVVAVGTDAREGVTRAVAR